MSVVLFERPMKEYGSTWIRRSGATNYVAHYNIRWEREGRRSRNTTYLRIGECSDVQSNTGGGDAGTSWLATEWQMGQQKEDEESDIRGNSNLLNPPLFSVEDNSGQVDYLIDVRRFGSIQAGPADVAGFMDT